MNCVGNTSYSLLLNGRFQGTFKGEQGLRQGDPISPLLFVLVMEYLSQRIQKAVGEKRFRYHPLCKKLKLTNLCFTDDLVIFCKGNEDSLIAIKEVLDEFSKTSGLPINFVKYQVHFGGVSQSIPLTQKINLSLGEFPLKYFRIPLRLTKWRLDDCGAILKKMKLKLHSWANKHLSYASRIQLIQSTLIGLWNYWIRVFLLPQSVIKEIEKLCWGFL
uniref:Reverse transcriptase domain-containing protein n=1 Tax=Cannabis sativa TaxID=3483 RepID=A0A803PJ11_CANSA